MSRITIVTIKILATLAAASGIGITFWPSIFGFVLLRAKNYSVFNEHHKPIDAYLFEKRQTSENDKTFELILYFPSERSYKYLTIVPDHKLIGLANQTGKNIWVSPGGKLAYMFPNGSFFTPLDGPYFDLISEYQFSKDVIWFNTFDDLKKLGNRIVIQRQ